MADDFLKMFQPANYQFSDGSVRNIDNFTLAILVERLSIHNKLFFKPYNVLDTETPESVSYKLYGSAEFWWTILVVNNIINPFTDWIRPYRMIKLNEEKNDEFLYFIDNRDGSIFDDIDQKRFKEEYLDKGIRLPEYVDQIKRSTKAIKENGDKNRVWVINPDYIYRFVSEYEELLKRNYDYSKYDRGL